MALRSLLSARNRIPSLLRQSSTSLSPARSAPVLPRILVAFRFFSTEGPSVGDEEAEEVVRPHEGFGRDSRDGNVNMGQNVNAEVLLPGCDFKHWLVFMEPPKEDTSRDDIIKRYISTLAEIVGSEEEAKTKIYSVSTKHYYAFGCLLSQEVSNKLKSLPGVHWVLPDSYLHPKTKDYGGEPFIDGKAVPYDPKYHAVWLQNNQRAPERANRRFERDRPRNFDRPRDNWQNRDYQSRPPRPPMPNQNQEFERN